MTTRLRDRAPKEEAWAFASLDEEALIAVGRTWAVLEHALSETLRALGSTPAQFNVLRILRRAGGEGLCRGEVMQRMIARVPDATRLLDRMESAGLIGRERDAADRRYVTTRISDEGLVRLAELDGPVRELQRRFFRILPDAEKRALIEMLRRVRETA